MNCPQKLALDPFKLEERWPRFEVDSNQSWSKR